MPVIETVRVGRNLFTPERGTHYLPVLYGGGRTNVYRDRMLNRRLGRLCPDVQFRAVVHELGATVYLYEECRTHSDDPWSLVLSIVPAGSGNATGTPQPRDYVLWSSTHSREHVESARLLGSYQEGTLAVEMTIGRRGQGSETHTLRLVEGKRVAAEESPAAQRQTKPLATNGYSAAGGLGPPIL